MEEQQARVVSAWEGAGRDKPPERVAGFWYSLAPNADEKLKAYVYKYIRAIGEAPARAMAKNVDRSSQDAVRASLDAYEELGVEECWLNSATAEIAEIDGMLKSTAYSKSSRSAVSPDRQLQGVAGNTSPARHGFREWLAHWSPIQCDS